MSKTLNRRSRTGFKQKGFASPRIFLIWILPLALVALGFGVVTDWTGRLSADATNWRRVNTVKPESGVVPDIAFNSDASPYSGVSERNLFVPWRKALPPPEPVRAQPEMARPQIRRGVYTLAGTLDLGSGSIAVLREVATGKSRQVKKGEMVQEYSVESVDDNSVVLTYAGQREELFLAKFTASSRIAPSPPAQVAALTVSTQNPGQEAAPTRQSLNPSTNPAPTGLSQQVIPPLQPNPSQQAVPPVPIAQGTPLPRPSTVAVEGGQFVYRPRPTSP